ncbi:cyclic nucleotide-binding domain protein (macronuclear) [Tetrahymena thermophila SB210]|uniref:Cyclic nucleotide-binding domain protein n=1 Tax=Tetrahymena thermophila (strain SB210) TaxID=312017 RepID=A4VDG8_TETTS|nr:cyclic nucleotide-binding domain protein [Tetrahymena thermophila SB210]EDK31574.2 cyclic nucleotide-binding domain protein [Tetrahymena thermophila SB210]|eukprot:XP_001471425.2 cyclic nucleotide-binding domain protein [Tetrahymena thermophila SB210]
MIDKKKVGKDIDNKCINYEFPYQIDQNRDDTSDLNGANSTQRHFLKQNEDSKEISFSNITNNIFNALDKNSDLSYFSNQDGAYKRRKLFELEEQEIGSTFRNINKRKDYYQENLEYNEYEENIYRKQTTQKQLSQNYSKELNSNPFNFSDKISEILNSEDLNMKIHKKESDNSKKHPSIELQCSPSIKAMCYENIKRAQKTQKGKNYCNDSDSEDECESQKNNQNKQSDDDNSSQNTDKKTQKNSIFEQSHFNEDMIIELNKAQKNLDKRDFSNDFKSIANKPSLEEDTKKKPNFLNVLFYITRFKRKMRSKINFKQFLSLKYWHFKLIDDFSYYIKNEDQSNQVSIDKIFSKIQTFSPSSFVVVIWHLLVLVILLIQLFFIPMKAGFQLKLKSGFWMYFLRILPAVVFSIEILLKFNTGYYQEGQIVMNPTSSILANQSIDSMWLDFIQFLHIQQMTNLIDFLDDHFQISQRFQTLFELIKLGLLVVVIAHFCGCVFHLVAQIQIQEGEMNTWLQVKGLQDEDWIVRYVNSLYWAIITMNTVGYGDITPNTNIEKIFVVFITVICCGVFGYAINTIGSIVREIALKEAAFKQIKFDISMYMRNRNISRNVQLKVFKILEYQNQQEQEGSHKASQILEKVPENIQNDVFMEFYGKILHSCKLFRFHFTEKFINALSLKMREESVGPGECIFKQGQNDSKIIFLLKGEVEFYVTQQLDGEKEKKFILTKIGTGSFFGHSEFFTNQSRQFSCQATSSCNYVSLNNQDIVSLLKDYQNDYENFCKLRDNLLLYGNQIDQMCLSCNQFTHSILDCPLIHLCLDREFLLKKNNYSFFQQRESNHQRKRLKLNSLKIKQDIRFIVRKIRIEIVAEQRPDFLEYFEDCMNETDQEFFSKTPIIKLRIGGESHEILLSDESEEEDVDLDRDLEEVKSNINNNFALQIEHMNSLKSNSQQKQPQNNNQNTSNNANPSINTPQIARTVQFQPQQEIQYFQKQISQHQHSHQQGTIQQMQQQQQRRFSSQNTYQKQLQIYREQSQQQNSHTYSQKSLSSMTDLQPQTGSNLNLGVQQAPSNQTTQIVSSPNLAPQNIIFYLNNANTNLQNLQEKTTPKEQQKQNNSNLLNVDVNDVYQPSYGSQKSRSQNKNTNSKDIDESKSIYSSKSGEKGKDIEKQDSFLQKSAQEIVNNKTHHYYQFFGVMNFESKKDYEFYFPHNNLSKILDKIKQKAEVKLLGTINVAFNFGNLQMRKVAKNTPKQKLNYSFTRIKFDNPQSSPNLTQEDQQNSNQIGQHNSPSKFRNMIK